MDLILRCTTFSTYNEIVEKSKSFASLSRLFFFFLDIQVSPNIEIPILNFMLLKHKRTILKHFNVFNF